MNIIRVYIRFSTIFFSSCVVAFCFGNVNFLIVSRKHPVHLEDELLDVLLGVELSEGQSLGL